MKTCICIRISISLTLSKSPHEPDHWIDLRTTINPDVHRRVVPGKQNSQGKAGWEVVEV